MTTSLLRRLRQGGRLAAIAGLVWLGASATAQPADPAGLQADPLPGARGPASGYAGMSGELQPGQWSGGGGLGMLGSTPDGTALSTTANLDYFVSEQFSVGPLLQAGFTDDLAQMGLSGQGKYWIPLPGTGGRGRVALQSGIGFVHADVSRSDTSWLVPLGVGYDYALPSGQSLTGTMLVNFTHLDTGRGADVMPGFVFGLRF